MMQDAVGKTQTIEDALDPARAAAMQATMGQDGQAPIPGAILPKFWHHLYFWEPRPPSQLGGDGHIKTGHGLIPDLGLPQRMWAGGRLEFLAPMLIGTNATKTTTVEAVTEKQGRSGRLGFVTLKHAFRQGGKTALIEHQDLVYRDPPDARRRAAPPIAPTTEEVSTQAKFDTTLLFRYSALTFNGHRIHYDLDYCRDVEGYTGLVVHGPLLAQGLIDLAEANLGPLKSFDFRATSALMHHEAAEFCLAEDGEMWARGPDGRQCMTARAIAA